MPMLKNIGWGLLIVVLLTGVSFGLRYAGLMQFELFAPQLEDAKREVFENSQGYIEGKRQEAVKYRLEYMRADSTSKQAIKMTIVQSFANFDESKLSPELQAFIHKMKYEITPEREG